MTSTASSNTAPRLSILRIIGGVVLAAVGAIAVNSLIAWLAIAAGAATPFMPLQPTGVITFTVIGVVAGAIGLAIIRRVSAQPRAVLRVLVPSVVALSLIPDVILLVTGIQPNTSVLGVAALMTMHLVTAVIAVSVFARVMPLPRG